VSGIAKGSEEIEVCCCLYTRDVVCTEEIQLDATQWFIELIIRLTCFGHYYAHHQELKTIQVITACGT
jgi:hypothetical protein